MNWAKLERTPAKVKVAQLSARRVGGMEGAGRGSPAAQATLLYMSEWNYKRSIQGQNRDNQFLHL